MLTVLPNFGRLNASKLKTNTLDCHNKYYYGERHIHTCSWFLKFDCEFKRCLQYANTNDKMLTAQFTVNPYNTVGSIIMQSQCNCVSTRWQHVQQQYLSINTPSINAYLIKDLRFLACDVNNLNHSDSVRNIHVCTIHFKLRPSPV